MDLGINNGLFTNTPNGVHNGIYTGINNGVFNGFYNENLLPNNIVRDGLIFYVDGQYPKSYPRGGNNVYDLTKNYSNGVLTNGVTYQPTNNGTFNFDGTNDYIDFLDKDLFTMSAGGGIDIPFSLSVWVNMSQQTNQMTICKSYFRSPEWGREYSLIFDNNLLYFRVFNPDVFGNNFLTVVGSYTYTLNTWVNFVATYNGNKLNSGMLVYANGTLLSTSNSNAGTYTGMGNTFANLFFGAQILDSNPGSSVYYKGNMAQCLIYKNKVLSQKDVNQNYQATKSRFNL